MGQGLLMIETSRSHSDTPQSVDFSGQAISPRQTALPDNTQHSQQTGIPAPGGIRNLNPRKRAATDPHLRPRGHWDRSRLKLLSPKKCMHHKSIFWQTLVEPNEIYYQNVNLKLI